jgi:DNA-binding GntR family transcriptional regulator
MATPSSETPPPLPIEPLEERPSTEDRVEGALRSLIVNGQLPEGTPLIQRDLAERLAVSQTPVRAALTALERDGFVETGPTGRSVVRRLTREDFEEISAARLGLEGLAARLSAPLVGEAELTAMRALLAELHTAAAAADVDRYLELRWTYFSTCYRVSGRRRLVDEVERLFRRSERYNRLVLSSPDRFAASVARYPTFLEACERRDGVAAERAVETSLRWGVDVVAPGLPSEAVTTA